MQHALAAFLLFLAQLGSAAASPEAWQAAWPDTDFERSEVAFSEILSGGPPRDGIPSIDAPRFVPASQVDLPPNEPVMSLSLHGEARAYPVRILMWHEIVNDVIGETPVAITYCPLCNSSLVFDRRLDGQTLEFGTTGLLRHSDMIMYDRQTETWWQQFLGRAIVGELAGETLTALPSRMEPFAAFAERHPDGAVLAEPIGVRRRYGANPYVGYDGADWPFLYRGDYDGPVPPLSMVVAVGDEAWPLARLREAGVIEAGDLTLRWTEGMASPLDAPTLEAGREVGSVEVTRDGEPVIFQTPFAFAFAAFNEDGVIHAE